MNNGDKPVNGGYEGRKYHNGITKREYFAAMAMQGIHASDTKNELSTKNIAQWAVHSSDALLAALEENEE